VEIVGVLPVLKRVADDVAVLLVHPDRREETIDPIGTRVLTLTRASSSEIRYENSPAPRGTRWRGSRDSLINTAPASGAR